MGVWARDFQQNVEGDVHDSSGPTSVGLVAGTSWCSSRFSDASDTYEIGNLLQIVGGLKGPFCEI
jgi:hypothetical protein